jgi:hypothetical protein
MLAKERRKKERKKEERKKTCLTGEGFKEENQG